MIVGVPRFEKNPGLALVATWFVHCIPVGLCCTEHEQCCTCPSVLLPTPLHCALDLRIYM